MERSNIRKIQEVIRQFLRDSKLNGPLKERQVIDSWEEIIGKTIARATKKIYIKNGKMIVYLSSSVVRNELYMLKDEIVKKLNEKIGEEVVKEIILH